MFISLSIKFQVENRDFCNLVTELDKFQIIADLFVKSEPNQAP